MEAVRMIKKPVNGEVTIDLPESFGEHEVEVIVLPVGKEEEREKNRDLAAFEGIWEGKNLDVEKTSKEMRAEWERDF